MHPLRWAAALCALAVSTMAQARPYTVDDALHLENLGPSLIDPTGRWLIQEVEGPYDEAASFANGNNTRPAHAQLLRVDLHDPGPGVSAFPQSRAAGYIAGPFSPSGRYLAVYHDEGPTWRLGILTVATRKVRWLAFGAEFADRGDTLAWRSDTELVALALPPGDRYYKERLAQSAMAQTPALWSQAASGQGRTDRMVGSGAFIDIHPTDPVRRLVIIDAASGRVRTLGEGGFERLSLSEDQRHLAVIEAYGRIPLLPTQLISPGTPFRRTRLRLFDLVTGLGTTPCSDQEPLANSLRWSPAGDQALVFLRPTGAAWPKGAISLITSRSCNALPLGALRPTTSLAGTAAAPETHFDWLGAAPIVLAKQGSERSDWFAIGVGAPKNLTGGFQVAPGDPAAVIAGRAIFLVNHRPVAVTAAGRTTSLDAPPLNPLRPRRPNLSQPLPAEGASHGAQLYATARSGATLSLWAVSGEGAVELLRALGEGQTPIAAADGVLVTRSSDGAGVETIQVWTRDGRHAEAISINRSLASIDFVSPRAIEHRGPNGEALKSWLYLPAISRSRERPPLLVMAYPSASYGEPPYAGRPGLFVSVSDNVQLAVAHGYAVLVPSLPLTEGATDPGRGWDTAIFAIVDQIGRTGLVDTDRVAYWGHSFGGYVGLMMATQTSRFKALIASAPVSDLMSFRADGWPAAWLNPEGVEAAQGWAGWSELGIQGHMLATPWQNRERYIENSPVFLADRVQTPVLLVHGDQDASSIGQSREMFSDLYRLNKDALFITFYGEGHTVSSPPNYRAYADAAYRFLDTYLRADAPTSPLIAPSVAPTLPRPPREEESRSPQTEPSAPGTARFRARLGRADPSRPVGRPGDSSATPAAPR